MNRRGSRGQSLVELVFAVGLVGLVMTGAAVLMLNSLASQSKRFDHKKASEVAAIVMEELVAEKENQPSAFWSRASQTGLTRSEFPDYTYSLTFNRITSGGNCSNVIINCMEVAVDVTWLSDPTKKFTSTRFFGRN